MHDDDGVVAVLRCGLDELFTVLPEGQVLAVAFVSVDVDEALAGVGVDEDQSDTEKRMLV